MATVPAIQNITMTDLNGAYEVTIPKGTTYITFQLRDLTATLRFAFIAGKTNGSSPAGPYGTVNPGKSFGFPISVPDLGSDSATLLHLSANAGGQVCEVVTT